MSKSLFKKDHFYTKEAQKLDSETLHATKDLFEKYVEKGYSPREIEYIMNKTIFDISLEHLL